MRTKKAIPSGLYKPITPCKMAYQSTRIRFWLPNGGANQVK